MKATIVYDNEGKIISISKRVDLKAAKSKFLEVGVQPGPGQQQVEVDLDDDLDAIPMVELHERYQIETGSAKLIKMPPKTEA
jgi:hypothetical protein